MHIIKNRLLELRISTFERFQCVILFFIGTFSDELFRRPFLIRARAIGGGQSYRRRFAAGACTKIACGGFRYAKQNGRFTLTFGRAGPAPMSGDFLSQLKKKRRQLKKQRFLS